MKITWTLNGARRQDEVAPDLPLLRLLRSVGCKSVKCGCETTNCGLCTVLMNDKPVLSCAVPAARADGAAIWTLEGLQDEAAAFGAFLADEGGEQCGFCNPGFIMNVIAMTRELDDPTDEEIMDFLMGNLCRCTGYQSQTRAIRRFLDSRKEGGQ